MDLTEFHDRPDTSGPQVAHKHFFLAPPNRLQTG